MKPRIFGLEVEYGIYSDFLKTDSYNNIMNKLIGNRFLQNGGRLYIDCGHPEYCTPECTNPVDLVAYEKAGESIAKSLIPEFTFIKNNESGRETFGCHENYSVEKEVFNKKELRKLMPFLVTRQIFAGSGKVSTAYEETVYKIPQRSDYIEKCMGYCKTHQRPIINTTDDPLSAKYKRLELTLGDSNMSEIATYLKVGTTALVLDLLEDGNIPRISVRNPVNAIHEISKDIRHLINVRDSDGSKKASPIEIQRKYLEACKIYIDSDEITNDMLDRWEYVLDVLETDPLRLSTWLDWAAKKHVIDKLMEKHGWGLNNKGIKEASIQYHNIDRKNGIFYKLQNNGLVERLIDDERIRYSVENPPSDTRAYARGKLVAKYEINAYSDWGNVMVHGNKRDYEIIMDNPFNNYNEKMERLMEKIDSLYDSKS